ncbi:MAG: NUDIX hydrolase [Candidatus Omnitrophica bacterium]|nr:NUDIX hydrolase [Candidatus Omnitrophota bacterium]
MMKKRFDGKLIKLYEYKCVLPNGHAVNLEMVKHPGAVLIVPFLNKDTVVFLRQYRPVIDAYIYELPAGTLAPQEIHSRCARRELLEETGYITQKLTKLGQIYPAPGYTTERIVIFKAEKLKKAGQHTIEADEVIKTHVFTRQKIHRLFKSGKIVDAKTICALAICGLI